MMNFLRGLKSIPTDPSTPLKYFLQIFGRNVDVICILRLLGYEYYPRALRFMKPQFSAIWILGLGQGSGLVQSLACSPALLPPGRFPFN